MHETQKQSSEYVVHHSGALMSRDRTITAKYDHAYVARYEKYPEQALSTIRANLAERFAPNCRNVCDVGFGTGAFLVEMHKRRPQARIGGYDVSDYPKPKCVEIFEDWRDRRWDLLTFFDSLEHFQNLDWIYTQRSQTIIVTVPWFHSSLGIEWFYSWKHRRPGEHLWHFSPESLISLFEPAGYYPVFVGAPEDEVRGSAPHGCNILTVVFQR